VEKEAVDVFIEIISGSWRPKWSKRLAKIILNLSLIVPEINSKNKAGQRVFESLFKSLKSGHVLRNVWSALFIKLI
jgi:hypothetical protein